MPVGSRLHIYLVVGANVAMDCHGKMLSFIRMSCFGSITTRASYLRRKWMCLRCARLLYTMLLSAIQRGIFHEQTHPALYPTLNHRDPTSPMGY